MIQEIAEEAAQGTTMLGVAPNTPTSLLDFMWWIILVGGGALCSALTYLARKIVADNETERTELKDQVGILTTKVDACEAKHMEQIAATAKADLQNAVLTGQIEFLRQQIAELQKRGVERD